MGGYYFISFYLPYHSIMIVQLTRYIHCFARNNLMNIMCKVGDSILKVNNIAKTSTQTNTKKRST